MTTSWERQKARIASGRSKKWTWEERITSVGHSKIMWQRAKARAKRKGLAFTIELSDLPVIGTHCPVLGTEYQIRTGKSGPCETSPTLDRIDSTRGYVPGNIEVISARANRIKTDSTPEELMRVAKYYGQKAGKPSSKADRQRTKESVPR